MSKVTKQIIPYGRQDITQEDINAVIDVLKSDFITQGPTVKNFEEAVANFVGAKHGISTNSATSSLHIACLALGLSEGDYLWTVPNTFVASANCALYVGAEIDFVDINESTWNIDLEKLEQKLKEAEKNKCLPKIIVTVAFAGQPCEQEAIRELTQRYDIRVIEDAAHAIGASRNQEKIGSCKWSDITVFSFHPVKIITTAEGGMCLTNDPELKDRMQLYRSHGVTRDRKKMIQENPPMWSYEQKVLGYNYRLPDLNAALGLSQLRRIDSYVNKRNSLAKIYEEQLQSLPLQLPFIQHSNISAFHLYVVLIESGNTQRSREEVFIHMREHGIAVNVHYMPVYLNPYYRNLGFNKNYCKNAESYSERAITLPLFPTMTNDQQNVVIETIKEIL